MKNEIELRNFSGGYGVSEDYIKLHNFLVDCQEKDFSYARLDWMITHRPYLEEQNLYKIGIWEEYKNIIATALFDTELSDIFLITASGYESLYDEMITYACENMVSENNPQLCIYINNENQKLQEAAIRMGFSKTEKKDYVAIYDLTKQDIGKVNLQEGFEIVSLEEERDYEQYLYCLFRGFGHEKNGETFTYTDQDKKEAQSSYERENVDLSLKLSVKATSGDYVAHCGMWYDKKSPFAVIEPVCTVPEYRKNGFGKAVVLEGLRRVKQQGAKFAIVGSKQQFYYSIGMRPYTDGAFWIKNKSI